MGQSIVGALSVHVPKNVVLRMKHALCIAVVLLAVACAVKAAPESATKGLVNTEIRRSIFLWSPVAKQEMTITVMNEGSTAVSSYDLAVNATILDKMAQLVVTNNDAKVLSWKAEDQVRTIHGPKMEVMARYVKVANTLFSV